MLVHTIACDTFCQASLPAATDGRMGQDTELDRLGFWPRAALERLSASWITTAEQLVAIAATADGMAALAQETGLPARELEQLVDRTRQALPQSLREELSKPADTSQFGTGANEPPKRTEQ